MLGLRISVFHTEGKGSTPLCATVVPHATNVIMPCGYSQYDDWKHAVMDSCVVMFMAIFSADSSMVRTWLWDTVKMMFRLHPRRLIWTMCHIGNDGMLGRHVIGIIRFQSSTLWLSAWIQHELIKLRSDGMNTEIWPVIHVSCDRLLECRLRAFWRYILHVFIESVPSRRCSTAGQQSAKLF